MRKCLSIIRLKKKVMAKRLSPIRIGVVMATAKSPVVTDEIKTTTSIVRETIKTTSHGLARFGRCV